MSFGLLYRCNILAGRVTLAAQRKKPRPMVARARGGPGSKSDAAMLRRYHGGDRRTDMGVVSIIP
jgi:hypothetical protein